MTIEINPGAAPSWQQAIARQLETLTGDARLSATAVRGLAEGDALAQDRARSAVGLAAILPGLANPHEVIAVLDWREGAVARRDAATRLLMPFGLGESYTLARAGGGSRVGPTGLIVTEEADVARIAHLSTTRARRGLLVEPTRTNDLLHSRALDNAYWVKPGGDVVDQAAVATLFSGASTASRITELAGGTDHRILRTTASITSGVACTLSGAVKRGAGARHAHAGIYGNAFPATGITINLDTGAIGSTLGSPLLAAVSAERDGWFRFQVAVAATSTNTGQVRLNMTESASIATAAHSGDGTSTLFWDLIQFEIGAAAPTSFIETTTTTITRAADTATLLGLTGTGDVVVTYADDTTSSHAGVDLADWNLPHSGLPIRRIVVRDPA